MRFEEIDIYPVITTAFCKGRRAVDVLEAVAAGGARIVQLREKSLADREYLALACEFRRITKVYGMLLIIDDRVDIALASGADGVHLGLDDMPIDKARLIAPGLIIGASTHSLAEALSAQDAGADYINIGPLFATATKADAPPALGPETLKEIIPHVSIPFTVMGGIKKRHVPELLKFGARKIAMVTEITEADDVKARVEDLRRIMEVG